MADVTEEPSVKAAEVQERTKQGVAVFLTGFGGYEKLKVLTVDCCDAEALPDTSLVVHVKANGINFSELMSLQGFNDRLPKPPFILGYEASGDVIMVGKDVKKFKVSTVRVLLWNLGSH
jgi:NADPH:quinone reductase-like Zn-dependent oxidoreductase